MNTWKVVALHHVATIERDIVDASAIADGTIYVGLENIQPGGDFVNVRRVGSGELASSKFSFTPHHLLYGKLRPYLAKIARPQFSGICSTDILPILPGQELDRNYLAHYLLQPKMVAFANSRATGANLPRLSPRGLAEINVPLPPLPEQRRLAEILERAETLRAMRRATLAQLDMLTQSIFHDMFGDPFARNKNTVRLGEVADILMGQSPPGSTYNTNGVGIPLLNGPTEFGERYPIETQWTREPTRLCQVGDILFCVRGATAGRLNRADKIYCLGRGLAAIRPLTGKALNADYLFTVLDRYYGYFQAKGVGSTFINISRDELESLPIPHVQQDSADALSKRVSAVEAHKVAHKVSLGKFDALFASLQHRAFRGEL